MIKHDLTHFPLIISIIEDKPTLEEQKQFFQEWMKWFEKDEPFVTLRIYKNIGALVQPEGSREQSKNWFIENIELIRNKVIAMATVVPLDIEKRHQNKPNIGIQTEIFIDQKAAVEWLLSQLNYKHYGLNQQEIIKTLSQV
ncbi:TPA: hypothetical protein JIY97_00580 [Acinetobacter baumannii]|nr:hypothetical protein [Acinetobacter baumannii]